MVRGIDACNEQLGIFQGTQESMQDGQQRVTMSLMRMRTLKVAMYRQVATSLHLQPILMCIKQLEEEFVAELKGVKTPMPQMWDADGVW
jgi:hypothetical protein